MTSQGSPTARFRRALNVGNVSIALAAAAEVPLVSLPDALALCRLLAEKGDERYSRAAARWLQRLSTERRCTLAEVQVAAGALGRLGEDPGNEIAISVLNEFAECAE